jgi:hypothetical protein
MFAPIKIKHLSLVVNSEIKTFYFKEFRYKRNTDL